MTYYLRNGTTYSVTVEKAIDITTHLPPANYTVKHDPRRGFFLEMVDNFNLSGKIYGNSLKYADKIIRTFMDRPASTGVLLTGEKGSGKTMLAKKLAIDTAAMGIPTLIINTPFCGDEFNKFIQDIEEPCVVLFDEFEKVYDQNEQAAMLTLLDGVFPSKKLFILTCNDKWRIDAHMRNRPGRIFYMIEFSGLDVAFIREYCEDNLKNKDNIDKLCDMSVLFDSFNFDMLKAVVEEMNRYDESPQDAMAILNSKPEYSEKTTYDVEVSVNGVLVDKKDFSPSQWQGNPITNKVGVQYYVSMNDTFANNSTKAGFVLKPGIVDSNDDKEDGEWVANTFTPNDIKKVNSKDGSFMFFKDNVAVKLTRVKHTTYNYYDF